MTGIQLSPDAKRYNVKSSKVVLSGTALTVTTIAIPDDAVGFRLYPAADIVRWNIDAAPGVEVELDTTDQTGVASDMADGGYAQPLMWENRLIEAWSGRVLQLRSATASSVIYVEFF